MNIPFAFVDVFATQPLAGAPLSLVTDADGLSDTEMREIAREFNQSETTFLLTPMLPSTTRQLRSFTPTGEEVLGAGHNALGAWVWLAFSGQLLIDRPEMTFTHQIGDTVSPVQVIRRDGQPVTVSMDQAPPQFGAVVADHTELAAALGLHLSNLVDDEPAQVVSTGAGHLLVPVRSRDAVERAKPDANRLTAALRQVGGEGCYLYTRDTIDDDATAYTRFFNPTMGIWEAPATGTAAGPLIAQLVAGGHVPEGVTAIIEHGQTFGTTQQTRGHRDRHPRQTQRLGHRRCSGLAHHPRA